MRRNRPKAPMKGGDDWRQGVFIEVDKTPLKEDKPAKSKGKEVKPALPLNEQPGRCGNCAYADFDLKQLDGVLFRRCNQCHETINVMTMEVVRHGLPGYKYRT